MRLGNFQANDGMLISFLQKDQIISKKEEKISLLSFRIQELTNLIKQQKDKVVNAYLYFAEEKELLQQLITVHLEYIRAKQRKISAFKFRKQRDKIYDELEERLSEEQMEKVEFIFQDCEELVRTELELENKTNYHRSIKDVNLAIVSSNFQNNDLDLSFKEKLNETELLEKKELIIRHLEEKLKLKEEFQKREKELLDVLDNIKELVDEKNAVVDSQLLAQQLVYKQN